MSSKTCKHVKENGIFCQSPVLRGRDYCYFHLRVRVRRLSMARAQAQGAMWRLDLPALEDMHSVQSALMQVLDALAAGHLDPKRAGLLLYGLQQAATNIRSVTGWLGRSRYQIDGEDSGRVESRPELETEFSLPKGTDIDLPPAVAFPPLVAQSEAEPAELQQSRVVAEDAAFGVRAAGGEDAKWLTANGGSSGEPARRSSRKPPRSARGAGVDAWKHLERTAR
jgi:hypothetical protein